MKRILYLTTVLILIGLAVSCKKPAENNEVIIYTMAEDFRNEHMQNLLKEKFPKYNITMQVISTGNCAAKLKAEGTQIEADIILCMETAHFVALEDLFADLSKYDLSEYLPELVPASKRFLPWDKSSGAIIINKSKLDSSGIPVPANYKDLLKPVYKGQLSMPNPKTSATGYMFLISLINAWGEDAAYTFFDGFAENVLQFTTSGSGPVNALVQGEVSIGLGMTLGAVHAINNRGVSLDLKYFAEGAPSITTSFGMVKGKETRTAVREVFEFTMTKLIRDDKELYCPEPVMKNQVNNINNYPRNITYANMDGVTDVALKERLTTKWKY